MQTGTVRCFGRLACLTLLAVAVPASAYITLGVEPLWQRMAWYECVVVGKIIAVEKKPVTAIVYPFGDLNAEYKIAELEVTEAISGAKGLTRIRIGFFVTPKQWSQYKFNVAVGHEGCFLLTKHWDQDFYIVPGSGGVIGKEDASYRKEVALIRHYGQLLEDPQAGLTAKDPSARLLTAYMLLTRYRYQRYAPPDKLETQPVDPKLSKLILDTLTEANWPVDEILPAVSPQGAFVLLGLTAADGWTPPGDSKDYSKPYVAAARRWLKEHAASYRIRRFVPPRKDSAKK